MEVKINYEAWAKIYYWTQAAEGEVSGYLKTNFTDAKVTVVDAIILDQICNGARTDLTYEAMGDFAYFLGARRQDPMDWRLWWHSHGGGTVFWSGRDEENIIRHSQDSQILCIVVNKAGEALTRIDYRGDRKDYRLKLATTWSGVKIGKCYRDVKRKVKVGEFEDDGLTELEIGFNPGE